jgi:hypothetical protein
MHAISIHTMLLNHPIELVDVLKSGTSFCIGEVITKERRYMDYRRVFALMFDCSLEKVGNNIIYEEVQTFQGFILDVFKEACSANHSLIVVDLWCYCI